MDKELEALQEALKYSPENLPLKKIVADKFLGAGLLQEAILLLEELSQQSPEPEHQVLLSQAYFDLGRFQEAQSLLEGLLKIRVTAPLLLLQSKVHYELTRYTEAHDCYEEAVMRAAELSDPDFLQKIKRQMPNLKAKLTVGNFADQVEAHFQPDAKERALLTFDDVGGLNELKENIRMNIIYPFKNPELFKAYGKKSGGGILLYGPPGCGKTFIARATAGECGAYFISIAIHEILDMYIGQSERNLHDFFEQARRNSPAVIFIDEMDAIGGSRQAGDSRHERSLTNQLLSELDGINADNDGLMVLGATNMPWQVDTALRRPGRFDRVLFVPPPDVEARAEILRIHLQGKPITDIDYAKMARDMDRYSGADIKAVCDYAADEAIKEAMKVGQPKPIHMGNLTTALKKVKPSTLEWLATAKNYANYSNQSGTYDEILEYFKKR